MDQRESHKQKLYISFQKYRERDDTNDSEGVLSIFNTKLCLLERFGEKISTKKLAEWIKVLRNSSRNQCNMKGENASLCSGAISFGELFHLADIVSKITKKNTLYDILDGDGKGWITYEEFAKALQSVAPLYCTRYGQDVFETADSTSLGVITKPHYELLVQQFLHP